MLIIDIYATSHIGQVRKGNEDNYLILQLSNSTAVKSSQEADDFTIQSKKIEVDEQGIVLAVSDGMGGALAGEIASEMAVDTVSNRLLNDDPDATFAPDVPSSALIERLYDATIHANHQIHDRGRTEPQFNGMGATFTSLGITPAAVDVLQVGDSRAYLIRNVKSIKSQKTSL